MVKLMGHLTSGMIGLGLVELLNACAQPPGCKNDGDCAIEAGRYCIEGTCQSAGESSDAGSNETDGYVPLCSYQICSDAKQMWQACRDMTYDENGYILSGMEYFPMVSGKILTLLLELFNTSFKPEMHFSMGLETFLNPG